MILKSIIFFICLKFVFNCIYASNRVIFWVFRYIFIKDMWFRDKVLNEDKKYIQGIKYIQKWLLIDQGM